MKKHNPFKNLKLDKEEREILKFIESDKARQIPNFEKEKKRLEAIARFTLEKRRNINLRISEHDLSKLKSRAAEEGIPYQTLAASILHKYTQGTLS